MSSIKMARYINFFPGSMRDWREIFTSDTATYGMATDLGDFLHSMIQGTSISIAAEGIRAALEDGNVLGQIMREYSLTEADLQDAVEELHEALP